MVFLKLAELFEKTEGIVASIEILERGYKENGFKEESTARQLISELTGRKATVKLCQFGRHL